MEQRIREIRGGTQSRHRNGNSGRGGVRVGFTIWVVMFVLLVFGLSVNVRIMSNAPVDGGEVVVVVGDGDFDENLPARIDGQDGKVEGKKGDEGQRLIEEKRDFEGKGGTSGGIRRQRQDGLPLPQIKPPEPPGRRRKQLEKEQRRQEKEERRQEKKQNRANRRQQSNQQKQLSQQRNMVSCGGHHAPSCEACTAGGHGPGWCNGECTWNYKTEKCTERAKEDDMVHPAYHDLIKRYAFQPVRNDHHKLVNIILVRSPFRSGSDQREYEKYKDDILFLGISSFEAFPLPSPNPFSANFSKDEYVGMFPGFLNMFRDRQTVYPSHVKLLDMSQSDFDLPALSTSGRKMSEEKKYDFAYSGTDQDVDKGCVGWSSFAKNWSFVADHALHVMCHDFNLTGVLVATKNKKDTKACAIPESCRGKMLQTTFLTQEEFFNYVLQSKFMFLPQIYDASPRALAQALSLDIPAFVNKNIIGGWKYVNEETGEFFHDMSDFKSQLRKLLRNIDKGNVYKPRDYMTTHYGSAKSGEKLFQFVKEHFGHRVEMPQGTTRLYPAGA